MEITLKKAADLARATLAAGNQVKFVTSITQSIFSSIDINDAVKAGQERIEAAILDTVDLITAHFVLRRLIGESNSTSGINAAMNKRERLVSIEKRLSSYQAVFESTMAANAEEASRRLLAIGKAAEIGTTRYSYEEGVEVSVVNPSSVSGVRDLLMKIKQDSADVRDEIAGINLNTKITIPTEIETILRNHRIII